MQIVIMVRSAQILHENVLLLIVEIIQSREIAMRSTRSILDVMALSEPDVRVRFRSICLGDVLLR